MPLNTEKQKDMTHVLKEIRPLSGHVGCCWIDIGIMEDECEHGSISFSIEKNETDFLNNLIFSSHLRRVIANAILSAQSYLWELSSSILSSKCISMLLISSSMISF